MPDQPSSPPTLNRASSNPSIYQRRQNASSSQQTTTTSPIDAAGMRLASMATLSRIDESNYRTGLAPSGDTFRRTLGASEVVASSSSRPSPSPSPAATQSPYTPSPQPPYAYPSSSQGPNTPRVMSPYIRDVGQQTYFPMPALPPAPSHSPPWQLMAPSISSSSKSNNTPTPLLRQSQSQLDVKMEIESCKASHTLLAPLGERFTADGITISAKKNNVLLIVADRWDQEHDCHIEWEVTLDRDADMSNVQAQFANGLLKVTVKRRRGMPEFIGNGYRTSAPY